MMTVAISAVQKIAVEQLTALVDEYEQLSKRYRDTEYGIPSMLEMAK